jgi:APA family basic amino acid/polyamine antiporter
MEESSWVNIVLTSVEVTGLLIVIAAGLTRDGMIQPLVATPQPGVLTAAAVLFFVYLGFEEIANMTEEVRSPARDLPPAIVISIGVTTLLYVLVSLAVVTLAAPAELAGSAAPLALAIEKAWPGAGQLVSAIALFATANTVLITLIATSRLAFSMSRDGEIPRIFGKVLPHRHTPWAAAVLTLAMSAVLIPIGNVKILAEFSSFSALLAFFAVNISLIVLRYRLPEHHRPFRLPLSIGRMPLLPLLAIASICLLLANFESDIYVAGAIVLMLTILVSLLRKYRPRRPSAKR